VTYAFDIAAGARERCQELAERNGVQDRVLVEGECTPARLQELLGPRSLVVCDCEGAEVELLDPEEAPALRMADLLVELHDDQRLDVDVTATLVGRFRESHDVTLVRLAQRDPDRYPVISFLAAGSQRLALHEDRTPEQQRLFLTPKAEWADSGVAGDLDEDGALAVAEGQAGDGAAQGAVGAQGPVRAAQLEARRRG
jgi:hypothetical protein